jgi:hypothetical protein
LLNSLLFSYNYRRMIALLERNNPKLKKMPDEFEMAMPQIIEDLKRAKVQKEVDENIELREAVQRKVTEEWEARLNK